MARETRGKRGRWLAGQSGNPKGRPKGQLSLTDELRRYLQDNPEELKAIVMAFIALLKRGNVQAFQELLNRIDGRVSERHELEAKIPVTLIFQPAPQVIEGEGRTLVCEGDGSEDTAHLAGGHPLALQAARERV